MVKLGGRLLRWWLYLSGGFWSLIMLAFFFDGGMPAIRMLLAETLGLILLGLFDAH